MRYLLSFITMVIWLACAKLAVAQAALESILPLDGALSDDGRAVELSWFDAQPPRVGAVTIKRRQYGKTGAETWQTLAEGLGPVMRYRDDTIRPGLAYEYQVLRSARDIVDVGYWLTGTNLPARPDRGTVYLVIDETIAPDIAPRLARFAQDLTGDGWRVLRREVRRWDKQFSVANLEAIQEVKNWLGSGYAADPFGRHAVILIGHVPVAYSGRANPDGHDPQPHATDLFYVEFNGPWQASTEGILQHNAVPGNFIEMQIGRIDFANLAGLDPARERHLLQAYFDKNHHWRMGAHGDLREAYGNSGSLIVEQYALRNIVGPHAITTGGGHHDAGEAQPWLWGVDFGAHDGGSYAELYANKAVFAINFGSGKQAFERPGNPMTALLAQPWYTLAVGWGGRPAWWLHHMALGGTIGDVHMRTVNNGVASQPYRLSMDYYPTGAYQWRNPIWVNLMGDPTARAFPLAPASHLVAEQTDQGISLSWTAAPGAGVLGYALFRAPRADMAFERLAGGDLVTETRFTDPDGTEDSVYMVRTYGLKQVYAGSFYTYAQGVFATAGAKGLSAPVPEMNLQTGQGQSVGLPEVFNQPADGRIYAIIEGPRQGDLKYGESGWLYTPQAGSTGEVVLRFSVSEAGQTAYGRLRITITD